MTKLEAVCRSLCRSFGTDPNERVDYGNGWRWYDYRVEGQNVLRSLTRAGYTVKRK